MSYSAGIAQATGTRLDSAAKHTMPCKMDTNLILAWMSNRDNSRLKLHQDKHRYCMQKDELILNVTQSLNMESRVAKAYPAILSSLCDLDPVIKQFLYALYSCQDGNVFMSLKNEASSVFKTTIPTTSNTDIINSARQFMAMSSEIHEKMDNASKHEIMEKLPYFTAQGYGLGTAWASEISGDTVGTVLVGGMVTVRNGAFPCRAGQVVQWYFDEEEIHFAKNLNSLEGRKILAGERIKYLGMNLPDRKALEDEDKPTKKRRIQQEATYDTVGLGDHNVKKGIALPKPYVLMQGQDVFGDKIRIFAKCMNGGRPYDQIDLMLMTQSL